MTTRNKRKLAALNKENCEEHPRSNLAQNSNVPRSQEDYITQVSEEIEGRVTKRLSKEFSRTENRILGALARLDDFRMNPLLPGHSGTTPEPSRNALNTSQGTNEDDSQNDPRPEVGLFHGQMAQNSGPEDDHDNWPCISYGHFETLPNLVNYLCGDYYNQPVYRFILTFSSAFWTSTGEKQSNTSFKFLSDGKRFECKTLVLITSLTIQV